MMEKQFVSVPMTLCQLVKSDTIHFDSSLELSSYLSPLAHVGNELLPSHRLIGLS